MSRGPYLGCYSREWDVGRWRVGIEFWPRPRYWSVGVTRFTTIASGVKASLGPVEFFVQRARREADDALLRDCYRALLAACCSEDGLDSSEGVPLLHRLEARFPDLKAAADRDYRP